MLDHHGLSLVDLSPDAETVAVLADLLERTVAAGGSVHFMHPTPVDAARAYWSEALDHAAAGGRVILAARAETVLVGTVTLYLDTPPNQPFRAEIWKLMVDPAYRGRGYGRALMVEAERRARAAGRSLLTLDTAVEGGASELYESLGWARAGVIPDYAYKPQGGLVGTAIYYKRLAA
jgi:ribosomal protein S18 acetylase RimI-like enzyme